MEKTMEKIIFDPPEIFVPDAMQISILEAVAGRPGCRINHVVDTLRSSWGESVVRSNVHLLLTKRYLDDGRSASGIVLRLTSRGRLLLQPENKS